MRRALRLRVLSDLHLEVEPFDPPKVDADLVVLAGDIHNGAAGIEWAARTFDRPVLYVVGNHEHYDRELAAAGAEIRTAAKQRGVTVLDGASTIIDGVRFVGCTLWTDFELPVDGDRERALMLCRKWITDFRAIRVGQALFTIEDSVLLHRAQRAALERMLAEPHEGPTVVITHHAPHPNSIAPQYTGHPANPGFVSDLESMMGRSALWIHGHTHTAFDYTVRGTRVVCNPRGYPGETTGFRADLVVTV